MGRKPECVESDNSNKQFYFCFKFCIVSLLHVFLSNRRNSLPTYILIWFHIAKCWSLFYEGRLKKKEEKTVARAEGRCSPRVRRTSSAIMVALDTQVSRWECFFFWRKFCLSQRYLVTDNSYVFGWYKSVSILNTCTMGCWKVLSPTNKQLKKSYIC